MSHTFHKDQGLTVDPYHRHDSTPDQRHRARLTAARHATGLDDLAALLDMLGLFPDTEQDRQA